MEGTNNNDNSNKSFNKNKTVPSPVEFLKDAIGRIVIVKLSNEEEYRGMLICLDGTMNVVLNNCEEIINNKPSSVSFPSLFIRGNNGML